jgi:epoxide hydrolase-like predicted phosphatase
VIKAIIFDVGGTYMDGSFIDFVNKSYAILDIKKTFTAKEEIVFDENLNRGTVTHDECFKNFFAVPISRDEMKKIKKIWTTTWKPSKKMLDLIKKLKKNYILAILSNSDSFNSKKYQTKGWYKFFDHLILSHEVGVIKPEKKIYKLLLKKLNLVANECLFIDDQAKVLKPANELGMQTIHFESLEKLTKELKAKNIKF